MITKEQKLEAENTIKAYNEQLKQARVMRSVSFGDLVRAKCTSQARAIGNGKCVYVSAMWNELCVDAIDMTADWSNKYNLPLPSDEELKHYA